MQKVKIITQTHATLLNHINNLFARSALATNTYLFKQMKSNLQIPTGVIIQERRVLQITKNQEVVLETLEMCDLVRLNRKNKSIQIIDFPTIRVEYKYLKELKQVQAFLTQKGLKVSIFEIYQGAGNYLLTVIKENIWTEIQNAFSQLKLKVPYQKSNLYDQMKQGVFKFKKAKKQQINSQQKSQYNHNPYINNNNYNNFGNYNPNLFEKPLNVFIRKAIDTDSQEQERQKCINGISNMAIGSKINEENQTFANNKKQQTIIEQKEKPNKTANGKSHKNGKGDKKKYKQPVKVVINDDDFPTLP